MIGTTTGGAAAEWFCDLLELVFGVLLVLLGVFWDGVLGLVPYAGLSLGVLRRSLLPLPGRKTGSLLWLLLVRMVMDRLEGAFLERIVLSSLMDPVALVPDLGVPCRPEPKMSGKGQCLSTSSLHCLWAMARQSIKNKVLIQNIKIKNCF